MSLQGTLDTFALPDVLRLLASTAKTGYLRLEGSRGSGGVWFSAGRVAAAAAPRQGRSARPVAPGAEPLFELLRARDGSFAFEAGTASPLDVSPGDVASLLADAEVLLEEWREVESVVPSLGCSVALRPSLDVPSVSISADQWRSLVAVAAGSTVGDVGAALALGELSASRTVKELVEAGLVAVGRAPVAAAPPEPEPEVEVDPEPAGPSTAPEALVLDVLHELADADPHPPALDDAEPGDAGPAPVLGAAEEADVPAPEPERPVVAPDVAQAPAPAVRPPGAAPAFRLPAPPQPVAPAERLLHQPPVAPSGPARSAQDGRLSSSLGELAAISARSRQVANGPSPAVADEDAQAVTRRPSSGPDAAAEVAAAADGGAPEERDAAPDALEVAADGQPVNRSALLKFLSSVRT